MANEQLERSLEDLREMESVLINVDRDKEEMVPRPDPDEAGRREVERILADAESLFAEYRGQMPESVADALINLAPVPDVEASPDVPNETLAETAREAEALYPEPLGPEPPEVDGAADDAAAGGREGAAGEGATADGTPTDATPETATSNGDGAVDADRNGTADVDREGPDAVADADDDGPIDFDEPFDEGVDVLEPTGDEAASEPVTVPGEALSEEGPAGDEPLGSGDGGGGAGDDSADGDCAGDSDDPADGDSAADGDDDAADGDEDAADGDDNSADGSDGDEEDIGDWGFGTVESPEEG
jgi:flagellar protein FlaI